MTDMRFSNKYHAESQRGVLERVKYFPRQLLGDHDMNTEQAYFLEKLRRHNRYLHGWGVVCGLKVEPAPTDQAPWCVRITRGYALCPYGNEIYVAEDQYFNLARCGVEAMVNPCDEPQPFSSAPTTLYIAIKYHECVSRPVRAMPVDCGCEEENCEYSRICDSFEITCLTELPSSHKQDVYELCDFLSGKSLPTCPPCPEEPWVVLASVTLPMQRGDDIMAASIDNFIRRQLFSTAMLQERLIDCCCDVKQSPTLVLSKKIEAIAIDGENNQERVECTITLENNGDVDALNLVVEDTILWKHQDANKYIAFEGVVENSGQWKPSNEKGKFIAKIDNVAPNEEKELTLTISPRESEMDYRNVVKVTGDNLEKDLAVSQDLISGQ